MFGFKREKVRNHVTVDGPIIQYRDNFIWGCLSVCSTFGIPIRLYSFTFFFSFRVPIVLLPNQGYNTVFKRTLVRLWSRTLRNDFVDIDL